MRIWWFSADLKMIGQIKETIRTKKINAEAGLKKSLTCSCNLLKEWKTITYMQERAADIRRYQVSLANLLGKKLPENPASEKQSW